jgi:hypothetical protein
VERCDGPCIRHPLHAGSYDMLAQVWNIDGGEGASQWDVELVELSCFQCLLLGHCDYVDRGWGRVACCDGP